MGCIGSSGGGGLDWGAGPGLAARQLRRCGLLGVLRRNRRDGRWGLSGEEMVGGDWFAWKYFNGGLRRVRVGERISILVLFIFV